MNEELREIIKQIAIIISLFGRLAFKPEDIRNIVTTKKQNNCKSCGCDAWNVIPYTCRVGRNRYHLRNRKAGGKVLQ